MERLSFQELMEFLATPKRISIIPHKNPDGDAIGSTLALGQFLKSTGHEVSVIAPNDYSDALRWLPGQELIEVYEYHTAKCNRKLGESEIIFTLDFNHLSRTGPMEDVLVKQVVPFVMIDHHQQPDTYAAYTYSDTAMSSTCQMVYHFLEQMNATDQITADMATCLYTGIMTDTGSFKYRSTTSTTHRVVADLLDKGAQGTDIHNAIYDSNNYSRLQLLGVALTNMVVLEEFNTAYITLSQKELDNHNFKRGDTEGFVNYGLSLGGIVFAVIFIENESEGIIKISFRSKGEFSVNQYARENFEGGGHDNAAGGRSHSSLEETVQKFVTTLPTYQKQLTS